MQRVILSVLLVSAVTVLSFRSVYEPDLGWHLAHGRENVAGRLVRSNIFSFTYPDYRQHYTSWLFDSAAYAGWGIGGDAAVQGLQAITLAVTFGLVYLACRRRSALLPTIAVLAIGFVVIEPRAIPRPHLASFAGMAACAWLVERAMAARSARPLWWTVPLLALWSNLHGECVFGLLAIGLFGLSELLVPSALTRREAARALGITAVASAGLLANPYGWGLLRYMFENASLPQLLAIAELRPAYLPVYAAFFIYLTLACFLIVLPPRLTLWEALAVIVFGSMGWRYLRMTPLLFLVTAPMVAARLTAWTLRGVDARALLLTALATSAVVSRIPMRAYVTGLDVGRLHPEEVFSSRALSFARARGLDGPLFNSNNLGGWLEWSMYPNARTFQDSRLQAYPPEHFQKILRASRSQDEWDALVKDVDWAMLSTPRPNALSGAGRFPATTWATVFWDESVHILVRRSGRHAAVAAAYDYRILMPDSEIFELTPTLASSDGDRLRAEARRNRVENPEGFAAAAVMCLSGDDSACADAERIGSRWSALDDDLALVRALRVPRRHP